MAQLTVKQFAVELKMPPETKLTQIDVANLDKPFILSFPEHAGIQHARKHLRKQRDYLYFHLEYIVAYICLQNDPAVAGSFRFCEETKVPRFRRVLLSHKAPTVGGSQ